MGQQEFAKTLQAFAKHEYEDGIACIISGVYGTYLDTDATIKKNLS